MSSNIDHKAAVEALLRGQGCANSLKTLLDNREISSVSVDPLINIILDTFSLVLSFVDSPNPPPPHHESSCQSKASHKPRRSSKKKINGTEGLENYNDSPNPRPNDGFTWAKYGQKAIKSSDHKRFYYRCTLGTGQRCDAKKKVQQIKDNPPLFRTIYVGQHTCAAAANDDTNGSKMIRFDQFVSESVMPQVTTIEHQTITTEDKDQRCNATKKVQKIEENPPEYRTIYVGQHTCAAAANDDTNGSKMIRFDQTVYESVMPQVTTIEHQAITMEDKATDPIMNQECDINGFLMDNDQYWTNPYPPNSSEDPMVDFPDHIRNEEFDMNECLFNDDWNFDYPGC